MLLSAVVIILDVLKATVALCVLTVSLNTYGDHTAVVYCC
jgi:hypothetical protein